jgi:hypothetical protein
MKGYMSMVILGLIIFLVILGVAYGLDYVINSAEVSASTITVYYVPNAQINLGNPGTEPFWQSIPWTTVPLVPTVPVPDGISGHTTSVDVKMAWTYVNGTPYIFVLIKTINVGVVSWRACPELTPNGQIWAPFNFFPSGWWVVNVSYKQSNESIASVYAVPVSEQIQYPPGWTLSNPVKIYVLNVSGKLEAFVSGAINPQGVPLNNGQPILITSMNITYVAPNGTVFHITSPQQFLNLGLNNTNWAQMAYNQFYPQDTAEYVSLFYNDTYTYPERVVVMWLLGGVPSDWTQVAYTPHMIPGTPGALSAGQAEVWHWNSNPRANNTQDFGYGGPITSITGIPFSLSNWTENPAYANYLAHDPLKLGFIDHQGMINDMYANGSSLYIIGGIPFITTFPAINNASINGWQWLQGNYSPKDLWDPSLVATGARVVSTPTGTYWCVEFARTFTTIGTPSAPYQVQFYPGHTYYVAFAVFQGGSGESVDFKSISFWWRVYIQPASSSASILPLVLIANSIGAPIISLILMKNADIVSLISLTSKIPKFIKLLALQFKIKVMK